MHLVKICNISNSDKGSDKYSKVIEFEVPELEEFDCLRLSCLTAKAAIEAATRNPNLTIMYMLLIIEKL